MTIPQTLPRLSMTTEPESPWSENGPDFEVRGSTATSFDIPGRLASDIQTGEGPDDIQPPNNKVQGITIL